MAIFQNNLLMGAASQGSGGYSIDQSIRFNDDDNPVLYKSISSTSSSTTNTISMWVKRSNLGNSDSGSGSDAYGQALFQSGRTASNFMELKFGGTTAGALGTAEDALSLVNVTGDSINMKINTTAVFRDVSAWYHIVAIFDTTNAISSERLRLYVNGVRQTNFSSSTFPSASTATEMFNNTSNTPSIGAVKNTSETVRHFDGYLAEIHVVNGYAYDPSYFGETNDNGIWVPKEYSGSYGTNGFYIKGADASALGTDSSGNGNNFTTSGLASNDQMADTPTNNYAVMNLLDTNTTPNWTASNGNLDISWVGGNYTNHLFSTLSMPPTGKWYFEIKFVSDSNQILYYQSMRIGLMRDDFNAAMVQTTYAGVNLTDSATDPEIYLVLGNAGNSCQLSGMGNSIYNVGGSISAGDVINFAREGANLWIGKNGTYYNSGNPATGSNPSLSDLQLKSYRANMHWTSSSTSLGTAVVHAFFGADKSVGSGTGFNNTVPSGFLALNTTNLGS